MNSDDQQKWDQYLALASQGRRREALALAEELARSLAHYPREWRERWTEERCRQLIDEQAPARSASLAEFSFPLLREVVVPVLVGRLEREDADAARWLAWLMERYSGAGRLWDSLPEGAQTPPALLRCAERWRPDDVRVLAPLIEDGVRWFRYSMHELPAGVLYGADGASAQECREMLEELQLLEQRLDRLGAVPTYAAALSFWRRLIEHYEAYRTQSAVRGFDAYLAAHFPNWREARSDAGA